MIVAVLGASPKKERYSNKAIRSLISHGHQVIPINPAHSQIEGLPSVKSIADIKEAIDTLSIYVGPDHIAPLIDAIVKANPKRVIINPGAESVALQEALQKAGIRHQEACTLVLLSTNQFV